MIRLLKKIVFTLKNRRADNLRNDEFVEFYLTTQVQIALILKQIYLLEFEEDSIDHFDQHDKYNFQYVLINDFTGNIFIELLFQKDVSLIIFPNLLMTMFNILFNGSLKLSLSRILHFLLILQEYQVVILLIMYLLYNFINPQQSLKYL
jgi:hypothetical protein